MPRLYRLIIQGHPRYVVENDGTARLVEGDPLSEWRPGESIDLDLAQVVAPLSPSKVIGIGRNYRDHAAERGKPIPTEPIVFLKPPSSIVGPGEAIVLPPNVGRVDYEGELGVVIGRRATTVRSEDALDYVLGFTCVNDVTARAMQDKGYQFSHAKGFDTFSPIGPCVLLERDPRRTVESFVNGQLRQHGTTDSLIFPVADLIAYVSAIMTLLPGDIIATGTPAGVGPLAPGDTVTVRVSGVGELTNPVV